MLKIGITGSNGFIGTHLKNYLSLQKDIIIIPFERSDFDNEDKLDDFITECNTIIHLAGLNRHQNENVIYDTNVTLAQQLVDACIGTKSAPHIIFSSSTQEEKGTVYGDSKKRAREILETWASKYEAMVTSVIIPNVFGPFGKPYYNSVVATFCHQLTHDQQPEIQTDGIVNLIYINTLIKELLLMIHNPKHGKVILHHEFSITVSELLKTLQEYKEQYLNHGIFPNLESDLHLSLFNTFRCYVSREHFPVKYKTHIDERGQFVEISRALTSGQSSYSTTKPGITRGNHFHTRKAERFAVIKGKARISLRRIDTKEVIDYFLDGNTPAYVDMPIWHTHNITNIGDDELVTLFWINEPYNPQDPDTYFVNV